MNDLLITALWLSLSGSIFILVLYLCKPIVRHKLSKGWQYYIWLIVIARLLLPFSLEVNVWSSFVGNSENRMATSTQQQEGNSEALPDSTAPSKNYGKFLPATASNEQITNSALTEAQTKYLTQQLGDVFFALLSNAWLIWLGVALILLIRKITIYQSFIHYIKAGRVEVSDIERLELLGKIVEQLKIKRIVGLYTNSLISSPLLIGFFNPSIILPTTELADADFRNTILHELMHYKRFDMFYKWLVQLTVCLHWFNPLVYLMGREINHACELSCDEASIRTLNPNELKAYGDTLLNVLAIGKYNQQIASLSLNEGKELMKERLDSIMNFKKNTRLVRYTMFMLTFVFLCGFAVTGAYAADTKKTSTPWLNMGNGDGQPYIYSQTGYYQDGYVFEMGWNLNEKGYNAYPDRTTLTLADKSKITVSFDAICKNSIKQPEVLSALTILLDRLKTQAEATGIPLEKPLVVGVEYVGNKDVIKLAEEYYNNEENTSFSAIFFAMDKRSQQVYFNKMFDDGKIALFSAILKKNEISNDTIHQFAEKAYSEDKLTFFSVIVPYMTDSQKQVWVAKCSKDERVTFLGVLRNDMSKPDNNIATNVNKTTWDLGNVPRCAIKGLVSENIVVKAGGDSFKIEVDEASKDSYTFTDGTHTTSNKREIDFERKSELKADAVYSSTIYVTIPKNAEQHIFSFVTESGNVSVDGLNCSTLIAESQSGNVNIFNTKAKTLIANSETGEVNWQNTTADKILSDKYDTSLAKAEVKLVDIKPIDTNTPQIAMASDYVLLQEKYTDNSAAIKLLEIETQFINLVFEQSSDNIFATTLSCPSHLKPFYSQMNLQMDSIGSALSIKTSGIPQEFDVSTLGDFKYATLVVKAPKRQYDKIALDLSLTSKDIIMPVSAKEVHFNKHVGDDLTLSIPNQCDTLNVKNNVGNLKVKLSHLPKLTSIDSSVGDIEVYLPDDPLDIAFNLKNVQLSGFELPVHWNYVATWKDNGEFNTVSYKRNSDSNKIDATMKIGTLNLYVK